VWRESGEVYGSQFTGLVWLAQRQRAQSAVVVKL
jgi:hypothetical protein